MDITCDPVQPFSAKTGILPGKQKSSEIPEKTVLHILAFGQLTLSRAIVLFKTSLHWAGNCLPINRRASPTF